MSKILNWIKYVIAKYVFGMVKYPEIVHFLLSSGNFFMNTCKQKKCHMTQDSREILHFTYQMCVGKIFFHNSSYCYFFNFLNPF